MSELRSVEERLSCLRRRLFTYLCEHGWPEEYKSGFLQEKYFLLDWLACQFLCRRCPGAKHLLLLWYESTDWIWELFAALGSALKIYFGNSSYCGCEAEDYDLVVLDHIRCSDHEATPLFVCSKGFNKIRFGKIIFSIWTKSEALN